MVRLQKVFVDGLGVSAETDFNVLAYGDHELWDSVAHMQLVAALENEFGIMLETEEVIGMSSYVVAQDILRKRGVALDA